MEKNWKLEEISASLYAKDLASKEKKRRKKAREKLVDLGEDSLRSLGEIMGRGTSNLAKLGAISIISRIGGEKGADILIKSLKQENVQVKNKAIAMLGEMKEKRAISYIIDTLKSKDSTTRNIAKFALRSIGISQVITPLLYSMLESNPRLYQSGEELIFWTKKEAEDLLIKKIKEKNQLISSLAITLLGKLKSEKAQSPVMEAMRNQKSMLIKKAALEALGEMGRESVSEEIITYIYSNEKELRETAARSLGKSGAKKAVSHLKKLLKDNSREVRIETIKALGNLKDKSSVENFISISENNKDLEIIEEAIKALGKIGDIKALDILIKKLYHKSEYIRLAAIEALGQMKAKDALPHLPSGTGK